MISQLGGARNLRPSLEGSEIISKETDASVKRSSIKSQGCGFFFCILYCRTARESCILTWDELYSVMVGFGPMRGV